MKTQLRGHCQICGRQQAVVRGRMAAHGYTIEHGWFEGACPGEKFPPMEVSRSTLDEQAVLIRRELPALQHRLSRVMDGLELPQHAKASRGRNAPTVPFAEAPRPQQTEARNALARYVRDRIEGGRAWLDTLPAMANRIHGQPLAEVTLHKPQIAVGSRVKVYGHEFTVERIEWRKAWGVGPALNGQTLEHVVWTDAQGRERAALKRSARLVA